MLNDWIINEDEGRRTHGRVVVSCDVDDCAHLPCPLQVTGPPCLGCDGMHVVPVPMAEQNKRTMPKQCSGYGEAGLLSKVTFLWVADLVHKASRKVPQGVDALCEWDAASLIPNEFGAESLSDHFNLFYQPPKPTTPAAAAALRKAQLGTGVQGFVRWCFSWVKTEGSVLLSMLVLHSPSMLLQACVALVALGIRLSAPVALRAYLNWLTGQDTPDPGPVWRGCVLALVMGCLSFALACVQHQHFWFADSSGVLMVQQAIAVFHSKLLRLNTAAVSAISPGFIINLVSNDVARIEEVAFFWLYLWAGPLEVLLVWIMVSLELDWVSALAGISATFLLIPLQVFMVRPVAEIRRDTAQATDARVRLTSEAIQGALACKVLGWEDPLSQELQSLRAKEARHIGRMTRIRATNMGLQFAITAIVSFTTFAVYRARSGTLDVASVFYALALLQLPKANVLWSVRAIQVLTELRVSLQRMQRFLSAHEPPLPLHSHNDTHLGNTASPAHPTHIDCDSSDSSQSQVTPSVTLDLAKPITPKATTVSKTGLPRGTVAMLGASYDWDQPFGSQGPAQLYGTGVLDSSVHGQGKDSGKQGGDVQSAKTADSSGRPTTHAGSGGVDGQHHLTLSGVRFALRPGELLGVCGEVGAGKSSLLAALLGELQPLDSQTHDALAVSGSVTRSDWEKQTLSQVEGAQLGTAVVAGSLAYCAQIPWVVAGTVRDNIVFGADFNPDWYHHVVRSCALEEDIGGLVAGDQTELGERGINLSGGQKARLALARAAYQHPDVALLDDPLSAVDPRVGRTLFRECIGPKGVMKATTRVLVTHQRQYLPLCDRVLVLREGRPVVLATWQDLMTMNLPEIVATATGGPSLEDAEEEEEHQSEGEVAQDEDAARDAQPPSLPKTRTSPVWAAKGTEEAPAAVADSSGQSLPAAHLRSSVRTHADSSSTDDERDIADKAAMRGQRRLQSNKSWLHPPLAWLRSFGPHMSATRGSGAMPALSLRRIFSSKRYLHDASSDSGDAEAQLQATSTSATPADSGPSEEQKAQEAATAAGKLVAAEGRSQGDVSWRVYVRYVQQMGALPMVVLPIIVLSAQAAYIAGDWWLSLWAKSSPADQADDTWLWVYGLLACIVVTLGLSRAYMFYAVSLNASTGVHDAMVARLLRAPLAFFHTNPAGRVLNRFSKDQGTVDDQLPWVLFDAIQSGLLVLGAVVLVAAAVPFVLPIFVPLGLLFVWIRTRYVRASREVKRWEAVTRSPVYATFSSTLKGLATIRAYGVQALFTRHFMATLDQQAAWAIAGLGLARWKGFRLDMVVTVVTLGAALIVVAARSKVSPALLGLAFVNLLQLVGTAQWFVRQTAEVENNMTCMERMLEYTSLPQEPARVREGGGRPPEGWPRSGALRWECVCARYRPGLPLVLKDVSFNLAANTVCGVVGRTGSGKSSLALTLFRLIDVTAGRVMLDGLDVSTIGVDALRSQLAIIPQDPVLFSGTVRSNLDPWGRYEDSALWEVLTSVQMRKAISSLGGLSARLAEQGDNLSVGQRQLFCLARALLQNARVLVLDEATANVDRETDALIHQALDSHVRPQHCKQAEGAVHGGGLMAGVDRGGRVLLVIAHRIDTILDSDHLLVLGGGSLLEQGAPSELSAREGGVFSGMVTAARLANNKHTQAEP